MNIKKLTLCVFTTFALANCHLYAEAYQNQQCNSTSQAYQNQQYAPSSQGGMRNSGYGNQNPNPGYNPQQNPGYNPQQNPGYPSGQNAGGYTQGQNPGTQNQNGGYTYGQTPGYGQGQNPGYNQGQNPGYNQPGGATMNQSSMAPGMPAQPQGQPQPQTQAQGQMQQKGKIQWYTNYQQALAVARQDKKPLLLFFTGSDWCGWCKKIDKEAFETPAFGNAVGSRFVFVKLDFPMNNQLPREEAQQNAMLKQKYGVSGFPTVVILDSQENFLAETGYRPGGGQEYADYLLGLIRS